MILARGLYSESPPERRGRIENNPTLLYSWWCTIFSASIIATRLVGRYMRNEYLFREDKIMALSIIPLFARMALIHVVLVYGTNNADTDDLTDPLEIHRREIGSRLVLAARIFYALFIWMAKFTLSEFLKRMTDRFWKKGYNNILHGIRIVLGVTFVGVVVSTVSECQPFHHYWQVKPSPSPQCRQGYAHLLTMGITNILTDLLLVIFPIPIIYGSAMTLKRKLSLISLFSMSLVPVAITSTRIALVINRHGLQQFRSVFASSDILAAAVVSNAIILGSFLRDRGVKKPKYKASSTVDSFDRRSSLRRPRTLQHMDSDEDFARSMGFRTNPELSGGRSNVARPARVADLALLSSHGQSAPPFANSTWNFPKRQSGVSDYNADCDKTYEDPMPSPRQGRRVSFYDVGGLLETGHAVSPTDSVVCQDFATAQPRRTSRYSQQSEDIEMSRLVRQQLDLRSFLSRGNSISRGHHNPEERTESRRAILRNSIETNTASLEDSEGHTTPSL
ncbi:unnamed protein product [Periconia digitata]|uniref:Rhodopsin domain-containing protein n=1 Tax=Periconia digitata TaxID=1303443 RepID=A0A9W4XJJ7_9PLEO|nr:unnamed protein product [Periconia digitata]